MGLLTLIMNAAVVQDKKYYPTAEEVYGPDVEVTLTYINPSTFTL